MPGLGSLAAGLRPVSAVKRGEIYIVRANDDGSPDKDDTTRKFQYFPASLSDSKGVTYQEREVPGGTLPIYQYTNSGARTIGFTAFFSTDVDHLAESASVLDQLPAGVGALAGGSGGAAANDAQVVSSFDYAVGAMRARLKAAGAEDRNVFIPGALLWLRQFMLPRYATASAVGTPVTFAPRKLWLAIPNSGIGLYGGSEGHSSGDRVFCHMTQCDITYDALFPSGNIRHATVALAFAENPQAGGVVKFPSWDPTSSRAKNSTSWYTLSPSGGRK